MSNKMRMSGLISGLDTDSVISQLVQAKRTKVTKKTNEQTKHSWKQDIWKDLNSDLKKLQSKFASQMRFSSAYMTKKTAVSNTSVASVIAGTGANDSVQTLRVTQLAKSGYLTGGEVAKTDGSKATALTKLSELGFSGSSSLTLTTNGETESIAIDENTSISDLLTKLKDKGLNASFDENNQRLFISSKTTGKTQDFTLTASDAEGNAALAALGLQTKDYYTGLSALSESEITSQISAAVTSRADAMLTTYQGLQDKLATANEKITELTTALQGQVDVDLENLDGSLTTLKESKTELQKQIDEETDEEAKAALEEKMTALEEKIANVEGLKAQKATAADAQAQMDEIATYVDLTFDSEGKAVSATAKAKLETEVDAEVRARVADANAFLSDPDAAATKYATKVKGQDAEIYLNDAKFTNNTNTFAINGLTITALSETAEGETVTLTTSNDTEGIYDTIKNFLKEYNTIINKIDKLYNAPTAKGYEPLSDDEKEAMSETEIEKYETKIKDSLLRSDSNLNTIGNALKEVMASSFEVGGKKMYLSDFGISTLDFFAAADNEKNAYHIDGDADDDSTSGKEDKLKSMIASDPDTIVSFFTQLSKTLYSRMDGLSRSVSGYRSFGNFYDDVKMKTDYSDYTTKIAELEEKANDYEDRLYSKFSKMEAALAKLQSKSTALGGYFGTGS